jgi:hypothetical protein
MKRTLKLVPLIALVAAVSLGQPQSDCDKDYKALDENCRYEFVQGSTWQPAGCCERNVNQPNSQCAELQVRPHIKSCRGKEPVTVNLYQFNWYSVPSDCVSAGCT